MGGGGGGGGFRGTKGGKQHKGMPRTNQAQNAQTDHIASLLKLTYDQRRELHDIIHHQNLGYQEILEFAREWFDK